MKPLVSLACFLLVSATTQAQAQAPSPAPAMSSGVSPGTAKLGSGVFEWRELNAETKANGVRRSVLDGPTATLDRLHAHITTLEPGKRSGEPSRHLQEEVIIVKEGTIEATFDGHVRTAGAGSVIFFASNAVTSLRNVGPGPATYTVVYYYTPLTPKS
jgi:XRE family transcriptional regulator, regulator of sulfur utilization